MDDTQPRKHANAAVGFGGLCNRCKEHFGNGQECQECGVDRNRVVQRVRRRKKATGKRGMNSGKVSQHGKK